MKFTKLILATVCVISSASALAQAKEESGYYGIGAFGTSTVKGAVSDSSGSANVTTQGNGWQIGLGYDINKNFAVEGVYGQFFKNVSNLSNPTSTYITNSTTNADGFAFTFLGKKQVSENVSLFGGPSLMMGKVSQDSYKLDSNKITASSDSKSFNTFGLVVGASFALDTKTDLRAAYGKYNGFTWDHPAGTNTTAYSEKDKISTLYFSLTSKF